MKRSFTKEKLIVSLLGLAVVYLLLSSNADSEPQEFATTEEVAELRKLIRLQSSGESKFAGQLTQFVREFEAIDLKLRAIDEKVQFVSTDTGDPEVKAVWTQIAKMNTRDKKHREDIEYIKKTISVMLGGTPQVIIE